MEPIVSPTNSSPLLCGLPAPESPTLPSNLVMRPIQPTSYPSGAGVVSSPGSAHHAGPPNQPCQCESWACTHSQLQSTPSSTKLPPPPLKMAPLTYQSHPPGVPITQRRETKLPDAPYTPVSCLHPCLSSHEASGLFAPSLGCPLCPLPSPFPLPQWLPFIVKM